MTREQIKEEKEFKEAKARYDAFRQKIKDSSKEYMKDLMGMISESIENEWKEFSYIASELHKRKIETIIDKDRRDIQLRDEATGEIIVFESLLEVKAFALGLDWGVKNAREMALCGLGLPILMERKK